MIERARRKPLQLESADSKMVGYIRVSTDNRPTPGLGWRRKPTSYEPWPWPTATNSCTSTKTRATRRANWSGQH